VVTFGVLGPLVAFAGDEPVALRGPRHRAVLARLLVARRRVVPVRVLAEDLWDDPPEGVVGAIQTFVAALRQALEPDRPRRTPARLLVTAAPGYALRADDVDAWRFEVAVVEAGELLTAGRAEDALSSLDSALGLWRGPAYSEFAEEHWVRGEVTRLDELRLLAVERRAEAMLALGRSDAVAGDLGAHVADHPWREHAWRLLALALYRSGRQGDALAALRTARATLVADLGVDPGPDLRKLESDILAQAPMLTPSPPAGPDLVGRDAELALLSSAADSVLARRRFGLVFVSGDAGAGKTALVEGLDLDGWTTVWGRNPEHDGVPDTWPWTQILDCLEKAGHGPTPATTGEDKFQVHQAVVSYMERLCGPVLVVLDDLHRSGEDTLALLAALVSESRRGQVLIVGTFRDAEASPELAALLGRAARAEPVRIRLGGLPESAVAELVGMTTQRQLPSTITRQIHERSGGNAFFARELARLYDAEGDLTGVPAGVRDVIRHRLLALPVDGQMVLRQASVLGREVDLDVLIPLAGSEDLVLNTVDSALLAGFLVEDGPDRTRFAHALVRDTLYSDISQARRVRWHARAGDVISRIRPDDIEALAHHYLLAASPRAAQYAAEAARRAELRFAPHEAARLWQAALDSSTGAMRSTLDIVMGLVRALAVTGDLQAARQHRASAITMAEDLGDPVLTAKVIGAFDVPGIWTANDDPDLSAQVVSAAERTLAALPDELAAERSRLLSTISMELRGSRSSRGRDAAGAAEAIARRLDDPRLLAFALNGRFMHTFERTGLARQRAEIGRELVDLARQHDLVTFEVLGHLILIQAHSALAEFGQADRHAAAADELGRRHEIPLVSVFTQWYAALRSAAAGRTREAEVKYRAAAARLDGTGMWGLEKGILSLALRQNLGEWTDSESPHDLLREARLCLAAEAAIKAGHKPLMERLFAELEPAAGELAGAGSGMITLGPVADYLAALAEALGRPSGKYRDMAALLRAESAVADSVPG
jgi:DNA-binding SARP family transcriptional activator